MGESYRDTKLMQDILWRYNYIRDGVQTGQHKLMWFPTGQQLADIGSKPLPCPVFEPLMKLIMVDIKEKQSSNTTRPI